ncbi:MAG: hypothetical protein HKN75_09375 [Bacteroidia bacterium]|nr:hypothetical protein [Bacteroidia bacterium]
MKTNQLILIVIAFLFSANYAFAQQIIVKPTQSNLGGDLNHAFTVFIDEATEKQVSKKWGSYTKKHKSKNDSKGENIFSDNAYFSSITDDTLDIYAKVRKEGTGCEITVAFNLSGTYIGYEALPDLSDDASRVVYTFAYDLRKEIVKDQIKDAENEGKKREKAYDVLVRKNSNLNKEIKKFEQKIKDNEKELVGLEEEVQTAKELLENQEAVLATLSGSVEEKEARAEYKKRKSTHSSTVKKIERKKSENDKLRNNIKDNSRDIKQNVQDQKKAQKKIKEQEKVIKELEAKEKSIK